MQCASSIAKRPTSKINVQNFKNIEKLKCVLKKIRLTFTDLLNESRIGGVHFRSGIENAELFNGTQNGLTSNRSAQISGIDTTIPAKIYFNMICFNITKQTNSC